MLSDAIKAGVLYFGDQSVTAQFRDQAADPMRTAAGVLLVFRL